MSSLGPSLKSTSVERVVWVDCAKGTGIILVVFGHTWRGLWNAGIDQPNSFTTAIDDWIYTFHMPLFFFLSGIFADKSVSRPWPEAMKIRLATLVYPYVIWATLQFFVQVAAGGNTNNPAHIQDIWRLIYKPNMQFWFIYALFVIATMYDGLRRIIPNPTWIMLSWVLVFFFTQLGWMNLGPWGVFHTAVRFMGYFVLGTVLAPRLMNGLFSSNATSAVAIISGFTCVGWFVYLGKPGGPWIAFLTALAGVAMAIAISSSLLRGIFQTYLVILGKASLLIYVAHTIFSAGTRIVLLKICDIRNVPVHLLMGNLSGIIFPLLLWYISQRYTWPWLTQWPISK